MGWAVWPLPCQSPPPGAGLARGWGTVHSGFVGSVEVGMFSPQGLLIKKYVCVFN